MEFVLNAEKTLVLFMLQVSSRDYCIVKVFLHSRGFEYADLGMIARIWCHEWIRIISFCPKSLEQ